MSRWFGKVGYSVTEETNPGVYTEKVIERSYYGDLIRNSRSLDQGPSLNDDIEIDNDISIIADAYAYQNFAFMKYVVFMGVRWKVRSVKVEHPRLFLSIGGVYNGPTPDPSGEAGESSGD